MDHVDIWSKGEVFQFLQELLSSGQIKDCAYLKIRQDYASAFYPRCIQDWASRQQAWNVDISLTGYGAPSSYFWPECPRDCPIYSKSKDFITSLTIEEQPSPESFKVTKEGIYFAGQYFDALMKVQEILSNAKKSILIIDGYINENVLKLLGCKDSAVEAKILTGSITPGLKVSADAFNKQYRKLSVRISKAFHDRFIIIDDQEYYHFGASIKDLGHRGFMFSRIEEPEIIETLKRKVLEEWTKAQVEI